MAERGRIVPPLLACILLVVVLLAGSAQPRETDASWTTQQTTSATTTTITVPSPTTKSCAGTQFSTAVTVTWSLPTSGQYTTADIAFGVSQTGLGTVSEALGANTSATTGPVDGVYTTTLSSTLLSGIVGSLLGTTIYISLWAVYKPSSGITSSWASQPVGYTVTYPAVLGTLGGTCRAA